MTEDIYAMTPDQARDYISRQPMDDRAGMAYLYEAKTGVSLYDRSGTSFSEPVASSPLTGGGWWMVAAGVGLAAWGFFFNVGVEVPGAYSLGISSIANADAMAMRSMILQSGLAVFVSGWVAVGAGTVASAIRRAGQIGPS